MRISPRTIVIAALSALVLVLGALLVVVSAGLFNGDGTGQADADAVPASDAAPDDCSGTAVSSAKQLAKALSAAEPGDVIQLEPGTYSGRFVAEAEGTAADPITLCGPEDAVLDGGGTSKGYVLHLDGASHWIVSGFSVQNGQKGVMADGVTDTLIANLSVSRIGDEAIHLRNFSTDNTVSGNTIRDTGLRKPKFGEGVYIGTAESNWCDISDCEPDASDRNVVENNDIAGTSSESIDIKEGSSDGVVRGNTFDGSDITGADSWVDVKGNDWLIEGNEGTNSPLDGFQTHEILDGWGTGNVFSDNTADVNGDGFGYSLTPELDNTVECSNEASDAGEGTTNVTCTR
jgi:nitrous oxidase accessory protein NosD